MQIFIFLIIICELKPFLAMGCAIFPVLYLIFLLPNSATAQTNGQIPVGASITAGNDAASWVSPSGDFAFGFQPLESHDHFLLSIWYDKIPDKTIVWYANGDNPAPKGSNLVLTAGQGLVLNDPQGKPIWESDISVGIVSNGVMNDTGNFVVQNGNSGSLWESFNHPTDTLLPTQTMEVGGVLFSRKTETNFSQGRFRLGLLQDGNLVLNSVNLPTNLAYDPYYKSGTDGPSNSSAGYRVVFNESGYLYILRRNGQKFDLTVGKTVPSTDYYHRATLNYDGVFTQYFYPKSNTGNGTWYTVWSQPDNICVNIDGVLGSGACGFNSICSLNDYRRPTCKCPQGFSLLDPNDTYGNCKPDFELTCDEHQQGSVEELYDFVVLIDTDWPTSDYERYQPYNEVECRKCCLDDCLCSVAILRGDSCWKKKFPLSNGRADSSVNGKAFIKVRKGYTPPSVPLSPNSKSSFLSVTGSVLLGSSVFANVTLVGAFCFRFYLTRRKKPIKLQQEVGAVTRLRCFTYKELTDMTHDFKQELGRGAFGVVYKGVLRMGCSDKVVAVKKLEKLAQERDKEFKTEVNVIGQIHHKNLVQLLGFCDEGEHRLLVYEFLSNGTLADFLFANSKPSWSQRTHIAFGIARGLMYLHEECSSQIIHCDVKPHNILLDDYYNARISDLGLAKLLMMDQSKTHTFIRGTKGYIAPEWFRNTPVTVKVDVYSFGVLLLEIICCRRSVDTVIHGGERVILIDWAYDCYEGGKLDALAVDDMEAMNDISKLERFVMIAIWCIQEDPSVRPTMRKVTQMLEGVVDVPVPPNPFPFSNSN